LPEFALRYCVTVGDALALSLEVRNTTATPVRFEEALHTYLAVGDVREVGIAGLTGAEYLDKADGGKRKTQGSEPIRITAETDRLYLNTRATCTVTDPVWKRRLIIEKAGSDATVVWNPWIAKAKAMPDFGDDEWPQMLCIETGNCADHAITLPPGEAHTLQAIIRVESR
jgi:D-hexose-6-phosphate mutarotase